MRSNIGSRTTKQRLIASEPTARRQATRNKLLTAAYELFAEVGFQGASVVNVCERAGFTRGAFYSNFTDKDELFAALLAREYDRRAVALRSKSNEVAALLRSGETQLTEELAATFIAEFFNIADRDPSWYALEMELLLHHHRNPSQQVRFLDYLGQFRSELTSLIAELVVSAGRRFLIPAEHVISAISGIREMAFRQHLGGAGFDNGGSEALGQRVAELLFALTEPAA